MRVLSFTRPNITTTDTKPQGPSHIEEQRQALKAKMDARAKADDERFYPGAFQLDFVVPKQAWNVPDAVTDFCDSLHDDQSVISASGKFNERVYYVSGFRDDEFLFAAFDAEGMPVLSGTANNIGYIYDEPAGYM